MSSVKVKYWGSGGRLLTKTFSNSDENVTLYYAPQEHNGTLKIFKRTKRKRMSDYDRGYSDTTIAYYAAGAWHSVE